MQAPESFALTLPIGATGSAVVLCILHHSTHL